MATDKTNSMNGCILGGYELREQLGAGGMGAVYKAFDAGLDRFVAVKVLAPALRTDADCVERFQREARCISKLHHPNLMHIYGVGEEQETYYFVMEYIEGTTLSSRIKNHECTSLVVTMTIIQQVLSALQTVHKSGLIHRDLKPGNIMIDKDERVIVVDFGLSKDTENLGLTTTGSLLGTPDYMAPEQIEAEEITPATDIYAVALVVYEMLSNVRPFHRKSAIMTMRAHCEDRPSLITEYRPDLSKQFAQVLDKALTREATDRYTSVADFALALSAVYDDAALNALASQSAALATAKTIVTDDADTIATARTITNTAASPSRARTRPPKRPPPDAPRQSRAPRPPHRRAAPANAQRKTPRLMKRRGWRWGIPVGVVVLTLALMIFWPSPSPAETPPKKIIPYGQAATSDLAAVNEPRVRMLLDDAALRDGRLEPMDGDNTAWSIVEREAGHTEMHAADSVRIVEFLGKEKWPPKALRKPPAPNLDNLRPPAMSPRRELRRLRRSLEMPRRGALDTPAQPNP